VLGRAGAGGAVAVIGAGDADGAADFAGLQAHGAEPARVQGEHDGGVGAAHVAHQEQAPGVAAIGRGVGLGPGDGLGHVFQEGRLAGVGLGPHVGDDGDEAARGQGLADEAEQVAAHARRAAGMGE